MADINSLIKVIQSGNAKVSDYKSTGRNNFMGLINDPSTGEAVGRIYYNAATNTATASPGTYGSGGYVINNVNFNQGTSSIGKITDQSQIAVETPSGGGGLFEAAIPIAAAYFLPGVGAAIGASLGIGTTAGTILASAAAGAAQGQDFQTALKNAAVSSIVNTGSSDAATAAVKAGSDPQLANALASAGGSIAKTVAAGGSSSDILNNVTAALVGSGVSSATGDKTLGAAAGGAVTGGTVGALTGAAGALAPKDTDTKTPVASADQQVIDAFTKSQASTDLASLIDNANLTPEERDFLKQAQQSTFTAASTAQALPSTTTDVGAGTARLGSPFAANDPRFISALQKNPELISKFSEYTNSYGFNTPELNVVYKGLLEQELKKDPTYQPFLDEYKKVTGKDYVSPVSESERLRQEAAKKPLTNVVSTDVNPFPPVASVDVTQPSSPDVNAPISNAGPAATPITQPAVTPDTTTRDQQILNLITTAAPVVTPAATPTTTSTPVTLPITAPATLPNTAPITAPTTGVETTPVTTPATSSAATPTTTTPTQAPTTPPSFVTVDTTVDKGGDEPTTTKTIDKTPLDTKKDTTDTKTDTAPITNTSTTPATPIVSTQAKPYSPELFIYGGGSPSTLSRSLGTEIQAPYYPGAAAQGLTAERGAGEIEGTETGKKRKNVWNEASLRLKDALGL